MKKEMFGFLVLLLVLIIIGAPGARAYTVFLDGVENAGWYSEDLTKTHLSIRDNDSGTYYYQWEYGDGMLPWGTLNDLVDDLNDGVLDKTGGGAVGNWIIESGGDVFNHPDSEIWKSMYLPQGWYELKLTPESHAYNLVDFWGGSSWNAYVQIWADYGDSFAFGAGYPLYITEEDALDYYNNYVDGMRIYLANSADIYLYINDWNSVDNYGSLTLDIQRIPIPGTIWLFISFMIGLIGFRKIYRRA